MATAITPYSESNNFVFVPTQISGLSLWLDAADPSSVVTSGSNVTAWNDKSGNGRNATGVATRYPTYDVTNRRIVFNGTNQYLSNIGFSFNLSQRSIFIVFQQLTYTLYTGVLPIIPSPTSGTDYITTNGMTIETSTGVRFYQNSGGYQNDIVITTPVALGIYYEQMSGTAGTTYRNGNFNSNATSGFTSGSCGGYAVGCRWSGAPTTPYLNGYMNEVIIFNSALTNTQRQNVEGYLAWKWNIQTSLPTTHPYYNNAYLSNSYPITYFPSRLNPTIIFPNQIPNLSLWLDAADSRTITQVGGAITQWNDKSSNAYTATGFGSPLYVNNVVNNLSVVRFNGTSTYFSIPGNQLDLTTEDFAIFVVIQYTPRTAQIPIIGKAVGASAVLQWRLSFDPNNIFQILVFKNSVAISSSSSYTRAGWTLFSGVVYRATSIQGFINATGLNVGGTVVGTLSDTAVNVEIGRGWSGTQFFNSDMGEILLYKGTITVNQRQQIEAYLMYKWGIKSNLPTNHPFYTPDFVPSTPLTIRQYIWQPTGMALWLDASDKATITPSAGGTISAWLDKSGNAKNPTFSGTNTYNSISNTVFTTGSSYFFSAVDTRKTTVANMTLFLVHRQTNNTSPTNQGLWGNDIGGGWNRFQLLNFAFTPAQTYSISAGATGGVGVFNNVPNLNSLNRLLYTCQYSLSATNSSFVNINGTNSVTFTENPALSQTTTQNTYFGTIDTGINAAVEFYEIILYTTSLSIQQRQQLEGYLAWKWNLQKSLPSSHPSFNFPPG